MDNLPPADRQAPVILLSKHQSTWETFTYPTIMSHPLAYVFKRELLYIPFFGWAMGRLDMIHIDRSKRTEAWNKVAEQGRRFMAEGHWVIMFPEGTRTPRGSQGTYKNGAARLAGIPPRELYVHQDGADWDFMLIQNAEYTDEGKLVGMWYGGHTSEIRGQLSKESAAIIAAV